MNFENSTSAHVYRFVADDRAIVIATDVAARGLDVPNVQHVIHYQVPRNSEVGGVRG